MKKILLMISISLMISVSLISYGKSQLKYTNGIGYKINKEIPYTGKAITHYENGKIAVKGYFKDGRRNGEWIDYYANGKIKLKENYKNGIRY